MKGYAGQITHVDLSSGKVRNEKFDEKFARKYLGGNGFAARTLIDSVPRGADPLGEENVLIFCTGPLTGTLAHGSQGCRPRDPKGALQPALGRCYSRRQSA